MPELPEVETVRRLIERECLKARISRLRILDHGLLDGVSARTLAHHVEGRQLKGVRRHGKQLFLDLGGELMTVHLGMTGDLSVAGPGQGGAKHVRLVMFLEDGRELLYTDQRKFGRIGLCPSTDQFVSGRRLGPDALGIGGDGFAERAYGSARAIKTVLLDQHVLAGVGNLYADEVLFQTRVHPARPAASLSRRKLREIGSSVVKVLQTSVGVASDFERLPEGYLLRARWEGEDCPRGNGRLHQTKVGARTSIFCPACQRQ